MNKIKSCVGKKYGRWTVINQFIHPEYKKTFFLCQCDCGNIKEVNSHVIRVGHSKSCGCLNIENLSLKPGEASFNRLYEKYYRNAEKRNLEFSLTKEQFQHFTSQNCFYCGIEPKQTHKSDIRHNGIYYHNGIDRYFNDIGYIVENCVPCCFICNLAKYTLSFEEFQNWVKRIHNNFPWSYSNV